MWAGKNTSRWLFPVLVSPFLVSCLAIESLVGNDFRNPQASSETRFLAASGPDADMDGVPDWSDDCAESAKSVLVDANGCELVMGVIEGLVFAPDVVVLSEESQIVLTTLIETFLRYPDISISVDGHTDNRGSAADNLALSKQRVKAVVSFMVSKGIVASRIKPFAFGESRPRAPNATLAGRERNRRIEINVIERLL